MAFRMRWPTEHGTITQPFGARPRYYGKYGLPGHEGIDFMAPEGSELYAVAPGFVADVRLDGNADPNRKPYGNQVRIQHDDGYLSVYAHLSRAVVVRGQRIEAGQLIGLAGNSGNSFGAHLHLSLKKDGATASGETSYPHDLIDPTPHLTSFDDGRPEQPSPPDETTLDVQVESSELGYLNMRRAPHTDGELMLKLEHGEVVGALEDEAVARSKVGQHDQWLWVRTSASREPAETAGKTGYVAAWYLTLPEEEPAPEPEVEVTFVVVDSPEQPLNLRSEPDIGAEKVGEMAHGTVLKATGAPDEVRRRVGREGAWLRVRTPGGRTGYAAAWYLKLQTALPVVPQPAGEPTKYVQVESPEYGLRVRGGPGVEHDQVWWVPHGTVLESLEDERTTGRKVGQEEQWLHVRTPAMWEGYVAAWYVRAPQEDGREGATASDVPAAISPHIHGIHAATLGEDPHTRGAIRGLYESRNKKGWIFFTEVCGRDPGGLGPNEDMRNRLWGWASQGYGVIVRLNNGYEPTGTLPRREHYDAFAAAAARWVELYLKRPELGPDDYAWTIQVANEQNNPREHPGGWDDPQEHITAEMYAEAFNKTYARIKDVLPNAIVCPGAVDPYNYMPMKLLDGAHWRPLDYFTTMLEQIDALDGIILHAYMHGPDPGRVTSLARFGGGTGPLHDHYFDFQIYRLFMERIPGRWKDVPAYITEINHICRPPAAPECSDPDAMGWVDGSTPEQKRIVHAIYDEINRWNARPHAQQILCGLLYRWTGDAWAIENKPGILEAFKQSLGQDYRWRKTPAVTRAVAFGPPEQAREPVEERRIVQPDDLQRIRGIGPKSEMVLNTLGIQVFEQLARYEPEQLEKLIAETGLQTRDLETWPEQAREIVEEQEETEKKQPPTRSTRHPGREDMADDAEVLTFNGINGATGGYELPPMTAHDIASIALGEEMDAEHLQELEDRRTRGMAAALELVADVDARDLAQTGWGVIFAHSDEESGAVNEIKEALGDLLEHRREQATKQEERRYREFTGVDAYRPNESKLAFLERHGVGPGPADPDLMPYYLLIVGDPEAIPYRFQYQLDVQYAVGRIHFDTLEEYAQYARSVVEAETNGLALPRQAVFFGVRNEDDRATKLSATELVTPLGEEVAAHRTDWMVETYLAEQATKAHLGQLMGGEKTPALLFTASHGMGFPNGHRRQLPHQGALLCQDWPGPEAWQEAIPEDFYFSADDVGGDARLLGLMAFFFACYGAGTPRLDDFAHRGFQEREPIAPHPFVARLPRRLLGHPKGGALAVVGHVERAWGYSFTWGRSGRQLAVFESTLQRLMAGYPVGSAIEYFNERYAELSTELSLLLEDIEFGAERNDTRLAGLWTANNDARAYTIIGDPAVRLPVVEEDAAPPERPEGRPTIAGVAAVTETPTETEEAEAAEPPDEGAEEAAAEVTEAPQEELTSFDEVAFALGQERSGLGKSLKDFTHELARALGRAADDISSLEVITYASDDMEAVEYDFETKKLTGQATPRALTRIAFDGDTQNCIPRKQEAVDEALWRIHLEMVKEAQDNRAEFLGAVAELATRLLEILDL